MSYKVYLRVRPIDFEQSMIHIDKNQINIKDPTNKQAEWQQFGFDRLFNQQTTQAQVFQELMQFDYTQQNASIICYGQSGSGKSYTLFGSQTSPGLVPQLAGKLLEQNTQIHASFQEIYIDQVKDLQTGLLTTEFTKRKINQIEEIWEMLDILKQTDIKKQVRTHLILTLQVNDQYNIQFIDLAGSERVAKHITETQKYQESIMISASLQVLGKCLNMFNQNSNKVLPVKDSKLTQSIKFEQNAKVILIGNINPSESNYEECLLTLQYLERTKNIQIQLKKQISSLADATPLNMQQEKIIKKQQDEIELLKNKVDQLISERKKRFGDLQRLLGLDIDLEKLSSKNAKEIVQFRNQQEALQKVQSQEEIINEQQININELQYKIKEVEKDCHLKLEKYSTQVVELREINKKLSDQLQQIKMNGEDKERQLTSERDKIVKQMIEESNNRLEDRVNTVLSLPQHAINKSVESQKVQEIKKIVKAEADKEFQRLLNQLKGDYDTWLQSCKLQYENILNQKNEEIEKFIEQLKNYREKKRNQIKELSVELIDLYDIVAQQAKVIERIELGQYSGGLKSFSIPKQDKPLLPIKSKFRNLFTYLDNRSQNSTLTKKGTFNDKTIKNTQSINKQIKQSLSQKDLQFVGYDNIQLEQMNYMQMDLSTLRSYTFKLRECIKEQTEQITIIQDKYKQQIVQITKERDDAIQRYNMESRKYNQTRVVIESQNRILSKVRPISSIHRKT